MIESKFWFKTTLELVESNLIIRLFLLKVYIGRREWMDVWNRMQVNRDMFIPTYECLPGSPIQFFDPPLLSIRHPLATFHRLGISTPKSAS